MKTINKIMEKVNKKRRRNQVVNKIIGVFAITSLMIFLFLFFTSIFIQIPYAEIVCITLFSIFVILGIVIHFIK